MSEFSFKNLSVKLFPDVAMAEGVALVCECCTFEVGCGDCTCTDGPTEPPCGACTEGETCGECTLGETCGACTEGATCAGCTEGESCGGASDDCFPCTDFDPHTGDCDAETCLENTGCHHTETIIIAAPGIEDAPAGRPRSPDVIRGELRLLRAELRQAMGMPPEPDEEAEARGKPRTAEEIDRLHAALLGAVAELDEYRARIEGERPPE